MKSSTFFCPRPKFSHHGMRSERCVDHYFKNMFGYACNRLRSSAFGLIKVVLKFGTCRRLQRAKSIHCYRYFVSLFKYVLRWTNFKALYNLSEHYVGVDTNYESVQADIVLLKQKNQSEWIVFSNLILALSCNQPFHLLNWLKLQIKTVNWSLRQEGKRKEKKRNKKEK